jgi:hypothetical protein
MGTRIARDDWRRQRLLEWLCTIIPDRMPGTQAELAEELGIANTTITSLKKDPEFLADWEALYRSTVGSPEKAQLVVERLHETATDRTDPRQVQAARAYLEAIDAVKPRKIDVTVSKNTRDLTDAELSALLAEEAAREMDRRGS